MLGCIWIMGGILASGLLTDWGVLDLGIRSDIAIIAALSYGLLGWAMYRASRALTLVGVGFHAATTAAGVIVGLVGGRINLGWADCVTTVMLIQGARGVVRYRKVIAPPAKPIRNEGLTQESESSRDSITGEIVEIDDTSLPQVESLPTHTVCMFGFCPSAARIEGLVSSSVVTVVTISSRRQVNVDVCHRVLNGLRG
jgi:hypothetical protein